MEFDRERLAIKHCEQHGIERGTPEYSIALAAFTSGYSFKTPPPKQAGELEPTDGGIWICHTCKTVIGPIIDDDENKCGCDVYEFEYSRYIPQPDDSLRQDNREAREKYNQLLYAVETKFPNESRHETALRYIRRAESHSTCGGASKNTKKGGG